MAIIKHGLVPVERDWLYDALRGIEDTLEHAGRSITPESHDSLVLAHYSLQRVLNGQAPDNYREVLERVRSHDAARDFVEKLRNHKGG